MGVDKIGKKNVLRKSKEVSGVKIKGYDFNSKLDYSKLISSYGSTGFQASNLSKAVEITNEMIKNNSTIFLSYTSNIVSSGLRDIVRYLVQNKKVHILITTAGGIEEDFIKCLGDFVLGDFRADGSDLRKRGINRIGNIFVPNNRYVEFEKFVLPVLESMYNEQKKTGKLFTGSDLIMKLAEKVNNKESIYYWAWKNSIPVFCPAITDGSLGDMIYFFKHRHPDFVLDTLEDAKRLNDTTIGLKKAGAIILGAGIVKHATLNALMMRNGADYVVYINTEQEFNGSDAGALPEEAVSWGKVLPEAKRVKVYGDASIIFPLLVAESFSRK